MYSGKVGSSSGPPTLDDQFAGVAELLDHERERPGEAHGAVVHHPAHAGGQRVVGVQDEGMATDSDSASA